MDTALLFNVPAQEREAESSQTLSDHTSATQLLRLQVEDLQKRLQEKDHKLSEAQQVIRGLRDEILDLQRQLEAERRKSQDAVQQPARKPHKDQLKREEEDCIPPPSLSPTYTSEPLQTDHFGTYATEGSAQDQDGPKSLSITPGDCPVHSHVSQPSSPSSKNQHTALSDSLHNDATPSQQRMSLRTLSVRLEDWGPKLNPDGVLLLPPAEHDNDDNEVGDINDDNDHIPDDDDINDSDDGGHFGNDADSDYTPERQKPQTRPCLPVAQQKQKKAPSKARVHECGTCCKRFAAPSALRIHERVHTKERPYPCGLCGKAFSTAGNHKMHIKRRHGGGQSSGQASTGSRKTHGQEGDAQTGKKLFASSSRLKRHMGRHTGEKPHRCSQCPMAFTSSSNLKAHCRTHTGEKPHACSTCEKRFGCKESLRYHQVTHTNERPFLCPLCGKTYKYERDLSRHQQAHTGDKPYTCADCGQTFGRSSNLTRHRITHTGNRTHLCAVCGKTFRRPDDLKVHQRVHTGEKPYVCTICGERFSYVQTLQSHQKREHYREESEEKNSSTHVLDPEQPE
ncbi:zinc finger protein 768-like [Engraulis encrasicolus]|uniref:zinc finger protein 768-like n=1 Tax=Engraulis encrasicolus TaxID=184585 RepID=UPI002FD19AF4